MDTRTFYDLGTMTLLRSRDHDDRNLLNAAIQQTEKKLDELHERLASLSFSVPADAEEFVPKRKLATSAVFVSHQTSFPSTLRHSERKRQKRSSTLPDEQQNQTTLQEEASNSPKQEAEQYESSIKMKKSQSLNSLSSQYWKIDPNHYDIEQLKDNVVELAQSSQGCKLLQTILDCGKEPEKAAELMKQELKGKFCDIIIGIFGKFLVPKITRFCSQQSREDILTEIFQNSEYSLIALAQDENACYSIQRLVPYFSENIAEIVIGQTIPVLYILSTEQKGKYFLKSLFMSQLFPNTSKSVSKLYNVILDPNQFHLQDISKDKIGCTTVCFAIQNATHLQLKKFFDTLSSSIIELSFNKYGNYIVQTLIEHLNTKQCDEELAKIADLFKKEAFPLSCHKFSSNVIEKLLRSVSNDSFYEIVFSLLKISSENLESLDSIHSAVTERILHLAQDQYGSYVLQTVSRESAAHNTDEKYEWVFSEIKKRVI